MAIIYDGQIRMAYLAIAGSFSVNGVARLHTEILKKRELKAFYEMTPDKFKETYNVDPIKMIDLKALMGDSSDNIPGVAGVGPTIAEKLIKEYYVNLYQLSRISIHIRYIRFFLNRIIDRICIIIITK